MSRAQASEVTLMQAADPETVREGAAWVEEASAWSRAAALAALHWVVEECVPCSALSPCTIANTQRVSEGLLAWTSYIATKASF
jgi:hypothetical protein